MRFVIIDPLILLGLMHGWPLERDEIGSVFGVSLIGE